MSAAETSLHAVRRLAELRGLEADRLQSDLAERHVQRRRQADAVERLNTLCAGVGASAALPLALSANCAAYKETLIELGQRQQDELAVHDAGIASARVALVAAACRRMALDQAVAGRQQRFDRELAGREQKRQDDIATQVWLRGNR
ncbi:hypothetical protein CKO44_21925 [Rubrivivax gelatinosus]|uniref:Flagellar FliJ protein n=1 Tax=Rubrivivax gelatinosus TaxID=28068 RepID=A0ABS1DZZ6_RUBGE|nr:flagellar FliJ family protein [Rubrivivax gelatinosus]MBK1616118.1 hypothetical protein [Rubrivivax gelatinosus]MBK1715334.1 hypothetical protein [Rubrivivax gelatinosus]MBZ8142538.1 hypothetical protein [Rubrivivax gelatinosus]